MVHPGPLRHVQAVAVVSRWVQLATTPFLEDGTEPFLIQSSALDQLKSFARSEAVMTRSVDIALADSPMDVIEGLKAVLAFPEWCGSSWDSIDDAFEEIRSGWQFPLILVVTGGPTCWSRDPHLLLQTVLRFADLSRAFSAAGDQFMVVYAAGTWGDS